jgi:diaminopimelate decarboxylase
VTTSLSAGLPLYPRVSDRVARLLEARPLLEGLAAALGSPCNVVLPQQVSTNASAFRAVMERHHIGGEVLFAHKANRSAAIIRQLASTPTGIDVASLKELQQALGAGFRPERIVATGPKPDAFLWLAASSGITVSVDSAVELQRLAALVTKGGMPRVRTTLRLSGFTAAGVTRLARTSRFGTPVADLESLLDVVDDVRDAVELIGVAYHLDTIGQEEKAAALDACLDALVRCRSRGHPATSVDIGGGFGVNYLDDADQWERWTSALTAAVLGRAPSITWDGHPYGLRAEQGTIRGALGLYPAHRPVTGPDYLDVLLAGASTHGKDLGTTLSEHLYHLQIEPGRALLDQAGLVLVRVNEVRTVGDRTLVALEANARDISLEEHGVLMDPVLLQRSGPRAGPPVDVYLLGNLCLEADLLTRRAVQMPVCPEAGDLLVFVNTAGYFMDFSADQALQQPLAQTVAAYEIDGVWHWCLDDHYWPTRMTEGAS